MAAPPSNAAGDTTVSPAGTFARLGQNRALRLVSRVVGAGVLGTVAGIHLNLWLTGYRSIPTIGWLFFLDVIGAGLLALVVLVSPSGLLPWALAAGALATAGTLAGLVISITVGLFGWQDSLQAPLVVPTIIVESSGIVALGALAALTWPARSAVRLRRAR